MYRAVVFVALAAIFPAITLAKDLPPKDPCLNHTELVALRNDVRICFKDVIMHTIVEPNKTAVSCHNVTEFQIKVELLFNKTQTICPTYKWVVSSQTFLDMLEKTIDNPDILKEFVNNTCDSLIDTITSCSNHTGLGVNPEHANWFYRFRYMYYENMTCDHIRYIEGCTIEKLNKTCPKNVPYVKLMYGVPIKSCPALTQLAVQTKSSGSTRVTATTYTPLVLITMPLFVVQYLLAYQR